MGSGYKDNNYSNDAASADEPITFDYLLKKVVENTAGLSLKTTEDGTTEDCGTIKAEIESQPAFKVTIDEDRGVTVNEVI